MTKTTLWTALAMLLLAAACASAGGTNCWVDTGTTQSQDNTIYAPYRGSANAVFDQIRSDHGIIRRLLIAIEREPESNRADRWAELRTILLPHMEAEERVFYPALQQSSASRLSGYIGEEEHAAAKPLFDKLNQGSLNDERWDARFHLFKTMVEHHAAEEEKRVFADAKRAMTADQQVALYNDFMQQRQLALGSLPDRVMIPASYLNDD